MSDIPGEKTSCMCWPPCSYINCQQPACCEQRLPLVTQVLHSRCGRGVSKGATDNVHSLLGFIQISAASLPVVDEVAVEGEVLRVTEPSDDKLGEVKGGEDGQVKTEL